MKYKLFYRSQLAIFAADSQGNTHGEQSDSNPQGNYLDPLSIGHRCVVVIIFTTDNSITPISEEHAEIHHGQDHHTLEDHSRHSNWEESSLFIFLALLLSFTINIFSDDIATDRISSLRTLFSI